MEESDQSRIPATLLQEKENRRLNEPQKLDELTKSQVSVPAKKSKPNHLAFNH